MHGIKAVYFPEIEPKAAERKAFSAVPPNIRPLMTPIIRADGISGDFNFGSREQVSKWVNKVVVWIEGAFQPDFMFQDVSAILVDMGKIDSNALSKEGLHPVLKVHLDLRLKNIPSIPVI